MEFKGNTNRSMLTIAIPTYNRARYLDLCLKRICVEIAGLSEDKRCLVKVYVSDNASPDDATPKVIAQYQGMWMGAFEAVRNSKNIGPDANIAQCYESAITPYVWIMGDDDVILPGGLQKILDVLSNNEIDVLYVNNYWFKDQYTAKPRRNSGHGVLTFRSSLEFARRTNVMLTFISGVIMRSGVGLNYRNITSASNLVQLSWVFPSLRDGKVFAVIEDWVVAAQGSNSGGYGLVKVFGGNLKKISSTILSDKPELVRAIQNGTIVNFFPAFILEFRKGSSQFEDKDMTDGLKQAFGDNWRYYVFLAPLLLLPIFLARVYNMLLKAPRRLLRFALI
ncbi:MAG: glycosyltransferase family 2 protein [Sideroxydans sp.]|nr:glycosyltransferase family 2 protein [Sideroxydans sp.]